MSARQCGLWLMMMVVVVAPLSPLDPVSAASVVGDRASLEVAGLEDQLSAGLRARLPSEFAFVKRVTEMVNAGQLPLELVISTFQWARRKQPYPFPYFERALRTRAAARGITI